MLSPDGALNLLPFAALLDEHGEYLAQRFELTYLTSVDIAIEILIMVLSFGRESSTPDELVETGCEIFRRLE